MQRYRQNIIPRHLGEYLSYGLYLHKKRQKNIKLFFSVFQGIDSQTWRRRRNGNVDVLMSGIDTTEPITITKENTFSCSSPRNCRETDLLVEIDQRFPWVDIASVRIRNPRKWCYNFILNKSKWMQLHEYLYSQNKGASKLYFTLKTSINLRSEQHGYGRDILEYID